MKIKDDLIKQAFRAGGSFKTRSDRQKIVGRLANNLRDNNVQIKSIDHLKSRHIEQYIQSRKANGIGLRTLQNEMAGIRVSLREASRKTLADSDRISNKSLGIDGASRDGTHRAMPNDMYSNLIERLELMDKGVSACIQLVRYIGLRGEESVQADKSLRAWVKQLEKGEIIRVIYGTKGGRARDVRVVNVQKAQEAIKNALQCTNNNKGRIIDKPNLKSAMNRYAYVLRINGCIGEYSPHSIRYAFACDRIEKYVAQGFSYKDALAQTSMDLGHGDGRGRYVKQVYTKR